MVGVCHKELSFGCCVDPGSASAFYYFFSMIIIPIIINIIFITFIITRVFEQEQWCSENVENVNLYSLLLPNFSNYVVFDELLALLDWLKKAIPN